MEDLEGHLRAVGVPRQEHSRGAPAAELTLDDVVVREGVSDEREEVAAQGRLPAGGCRE
jgi:hypothetical protein